MTKPIEKAIVIILLILCMPFLAAWLITLIFGDLLLAFIGGFFFLYLGAAAMEDIYSKKKRNSVYW